MKNTARTLYILRETPLLDGLAEHEFEAIARFTTIRHLDTHQSLFWQGEPSAHFFYLHQGSVKLTRCDGKGRQKTLALIGARQFVAEHTLFSGNGYPVTAIALEDTELIAIQSMAFSRFARTHLELCGRLLNQLSSTIDLLVAEIEHLSTHAAEERIAAFLVERMNLEQPTHPVAGVPPRRTDLADLLSLSQETVSRVISRFRRLRWIRTQGHAIYVLRPDALQDLLVNPATERDHGS